MDDTQTPSATTDSSAPSVVSTPSAEPSSVGSSTPTERPTSMAAAFAQVAAKRSADTGDAATTAPPATATPEGIDKPATKQGPIPFDVHSTALANARTKEREAAQAEWRSQYGWAEQVDRAQVQEAARLGNLFQTDRAAFVRELIGDNPDQALISEFARTLSSRRGQGSNAVDLDPDVHVTDQAGNPTGVSTYSAQKVKAIVDQAITDALTKEVGPIKDTWQQIQNERHAEQHTNERKQFASSTTAELRQLPHFTEHEAAIKAEFGNMTLRNPDDLNEVALALHKAYTKVLTGQVIPNLSRTEQASAVASLKQKAVALVETPSGSAPAPSARPKTPAELAKYMADRSASRARTR